ncbi:hypothetical protein [Pontiella sp.]|uniref:hypothetical protein n=1 Tax=Pontiella sp. TaxID=2837462 RepID=UPI003563103C
MSETTVDIDGNGLGTDGYIFFGDFDAESANVSYGGVGIEITNMAATAVTDMMPSYITSATMGSGCNSKIGHYPQYEQIDNPLIGDGTDGPCANIIILSSTSGEALNFTVSSLPAGQILRLGVVTVLNDGAPNERWEIPTISLFDGTDTVSVTNLPNLSNVADTDGPGWVFFDIDSDGNYTLSLPADAAGIDPDHTGLGGVTFDTGTPPPNASLTLDPAAVSLNLYAPNTSVDGIITASYAAGAVTSNDITIASVTADAGFSASVTDPVLGNSDTEEVITVTFDNSGIGLVNGESTNSTLEVVWSEAGVGVITTSSIPLSVTYINEPNSFDLSPSSLSMTLTAPATSINGTIAASYIEGTVAAGIEIISVVVTNGFSVSPDSFTMSEFNTNQEIVVTYTNTGALENHADTAASSVVVTWTETGSGVTNTASGSVEVFYYNPTINDALIAGYDFDDGTGTATTNVTDYNPYVVASGYGVGTGLVSVISANGNGLAEELDAEYNLFGTTNQISFGSASSSLLYTLMNDEDNLALAITNADYMVFTVAPTNDYAMDLTSFTFRSRVNQLASSAERWALFSSVDGFATTNAAIATGQTTVTHTYVNNVVDLSDAKFQGLEGEVEFRLYMYGGASGYSSATLFDKVVLNGSVYPLALPPVSVSVSGGSVTMSWEDGRTYNVLTNGNLMFGDWGVAETGVSSPVSISIGSEDQMFYTLGK